MARLEALSLRTPVTTNPCGALPDRWKLLPPQSISPLRQHQTRTNVQLACRAFEAGPARLNATLQQAGFAVQLGEQNRLVQIGREAAVHVARYLVENERLLVVAASTMIMSLSHTALRPVLPVFAKGFGVGAAAVGTTISVYAVARLMMNVPAGILADSRGRKPLLVWGPAITALGMLGCGLAGSFRQLLFWRWITGVGSALQMAGAQLFLADISLSSNRARTLGTNQAASLLGALIGPALGGLLADVHGIRAPFTLTGVAAACAALYGLLRLPETRHAAPPPGRLRNNAVPATLQRPASLPQEQLVAAHAQPSAHSPSLLINERLNDSTASTSQRGSAALVCSSGSPRQLQQPCSAWRQLLASRNFHAIAAVNAVMFATANGTRSVLMPLLAIQGFGMKTTFLGLIFAGMAVISLVGVMPAAFVADHLGKKWTIVPSCLGMAFSLGLMALTGRVDGFLIAAAAYAVSNACIGATPAAYAADIMPHNVSGLGLGIYRCAGDLGLMVGPALLGWICDITSVQRAMGINAIVLSLAVSFFAVAAKEPAKLSTPPQHAPKLV